MYIFLLGVVDIMLIGSWTVYRETLRLDLVSVGRQNMKEERIVWHRVRRTRHPTWSRVVEAHFTH